jgi:hypothetical protein
MSAGKKEHYRSPLSIILKENTLNLSKYFKSKHLNFEKLNCDHKHIKQKLPKDVCTRWKGMDHALRSNNVCLAQIRFVINAPKHVTKPKGYVAALVTLISLIRS